MRYLDPKNDLTFKRIFGEHPNLLKSFLNALLPVDSPIETIEYLPAELVPEIPIFKNSIVDVRCHDQNGKQFIVEMQMLWTDSFKSRVLFNASKAFVKQIDRGTEYKGLQPVYSLCVVNEVFEPKLPEHLHHYKIVHTQHDDKVIPGLEFVFIELPKFKSQKIQDKKLSVLWLRFLSEIQDEQEEIPQEFYEDEDISQALSLLQESSYTKGQLETYDKYWDSISTEKTLILDSYDEGKIEGEQIGLEKGEQIGLEKGKIEGKIETIINGYKNGFTVNQLAVLTQLTENEVIEILKNHDFSV